jgi:hypothetical protein
MTDSAGQFVERVSDEGQSFEVGIRVDYFRRAPGSRERNLEKAALGAFEVLGCKRVEVGGRRWLDIRLRRLPYVWPAPADRPGTVGRDHALPS